MTHNHMCTRCELRFRTESELKEHLVLDHGFEPESLERHYASEQPESAAPEAAPEAAPSAARRYLLVANQTLGGEELTAAVRERLAEGRCRFHVLVPDTEAADYAARYRPESDTVASADARRRLDSQLAWLRDEGAEADGEIGDPGVLDAIGDILDREQFDEILLSTLPPGVSRWLRMDLPHRVERRFGLPVHLVAAQDHAPA